MTLTELILVGLALIILLLVLFGIAAISATGRVVGRKRDGRRRARSRTEPQDPWTESGRRAGESKDPDD